MAIVVVGAGTTTGGGGAATVVVGTAGATGRATVVVGASVSALDAVVVGAGVVVEALAVVDDSTTRVVDVGDVRAVGSPSLMPATTERPSTPTMPIPATNGQRRFFSDCLGGRAHGSGG
ncbi:hypothetical protein AB0J48_24985 [Nocardia salmonicida]|uniref:hypothetical protein n=1 Tax=Nocardia salmonicida TaxID=53431 RepID=UPI003425187E